VGLVLDCHIYFVTYMYVPAFIDPIGEMLPHIMLTQRWRLVARWPNGKVFHRRQNFKRSKGEINVHTKRNKALRGRFEACSNMHCYAIFRMTLLQEISRPPAFAHYWSGCTAAAAFAQQDDAGEAPTD
jgi:hypothetical protein